MCGILFRLSQNLLNDKQQIWKNLIENVSKRGPDFQKEITLQTIKKQNLNFYSSILNLRGDKNHPTAQPLEDNAENLLMFNGEIFDGVNVANNENDAFKLSVELSNVNGNKNKSNISDYVEVMGRVRGPFSFLFLHKKLNFLLFGRDVLGRRSLLWNLNELKNNESDEFLITSVGTEGSKYQEVPANGFYCLDLNGLDYFVYVQEEQQNQGAYSYVLPRLNQLLPEGMELRYVGREALCAPAVGVSSVHKKEQAWVIDTAFA
ncbi:Asparagine synthetase domain-containing protein 1 [Clydaea vesicula]|uniref:Asparagine synthetase domain-containing protein 1 n=1 Tax=Clydaea vesicula TaxID=447962 RepID=A0AAD5TZS8_9FUNG|nr:Asparagine synthetase domain-containing protein 1 [Clydaea vesicula]